MLNKIQLEECQILAHYQFADGQRILTLASTKIPNLTNPGQFVHLRVGDLKMRRPISIMSIDTKNSTFELLYKITGSGTKKLAQKQIGDYISVLGPIGNGFNLNKKKLPLLLGGGVGMPPIIALAQKIKNYYYYDPFVILGSEIPFPFTIMKSKIGPDCKINATMPLLENWGIAARLASLQNFTGIYQGYLTDLAIKYLEKLNTKELAQIQIYSCGPYPMLKTVAELAKKFNVKAQLSLEEFMACGVGGCAGCVVKTKNKMGEKMQRVCVDGPVFTSESIFYVN